MKICFSCGKEKDESEYGSNGKSSTGKPRLKPRCIPCNQIYEMEVFTEKLHKAIGGEENLKCSKCGYDKHVAVLEFHHIVPTDKEHAISKMKNYSYVKLKEEIDKCVLLCSNCHRELHVELRTN